MSDYESLAAAVLPPKEGAIRVLAVTTSASSVQDALGSDLPIRSFVTFICDQDCYLTFTAAGSNTITDPDATATTGNARTWLVPAKQPFNVVLTNTDRYFKARAAGSGMLRWYISSK